jgi:hypothetical protein
VRLAAVVCPVGFVLSSLRPALGFGGNGAAWMTWAGACCRGVLYGYCGTMDAAMQAVGPRPLRGGTWNCARKADQLVYHVEYLWGSNYL